MSDHVCGLRGFDPTIDDCHACTENRSPKLVKMIRLWIADSPYSQRDIAAAIGISESSFSAMLIGKHVINGPAMAKLICWLLLP